VDLTQLHTRNTGVQFPAVAMMEYFFLRRRVQTGSGAHPASYPVSTKEALSPGVKRPGREADHSPKPCAKVKNAWSFTSTPPLHLRGVVVN
jgi:hypothetical protein